jgi:hypothetical protein
MSSNIYVPVDQHVLLPIVSKITINVCSQRFTRSIGDYLVIKTKGTSFLRDDVLCYTDHEFDPIDLHGSVIIPGAIGFTELVVYLYLTRTYRGRPADIVYKYWFDGHIGTGATIVIRDGDHYHPAIKFGGLSAKRCLLLSITLHEPTIMDHLACLFRHICCGHWDENEIDLSSGYAVSLS